MISSIQDYVRHFDIITLYLLEETQTDNLGRLLTKGLGFYSIEESQDHYGKKAYFPINFNNQIVESIENLISITQKNIEKQFNKKTTHSPIPRFHFVLNSKPDFCPDFIIEADKKIEYRDVEQVKINGNNYYAKDYVINKL